MKRAFWFFAVVVFVFVVYGCKQVTVQAISWSDRPLPLIYRLNGGENSFKSL